MSPMRVLRSCALLVAAVLLLTGLAGAVRADGCPWYDPFHLSCPCPTVCYTRTTLFHYHCVCPKPICDPCNLEHYGYYHTCWQPWPFPPDYRHCQGPGLCAAAHQAATLGTPAPTEPGSSAPGPMPRADQQLPEPRKGTNGDELPAPRP